MHMPVHGAEPALMVTRVIDSRVAKQYLAVSVSMREYLDKVVERPFVHKLPI